MRTTLLAMVLAFVAAAADAPQVVRIYPGPAPGAEGSARKEKEYFSKDWKTQVVTNVSDPTLTVFRADPATATGTAVIVCPGGGFHALSITSEGTDVAKWLAGKGVTAFVLKYRIVPTGEDGAKEVSEKLAARDRTKFNAEVTPYIRLAVADALAAMRYVRQHASAFGIAPERTGIMGFSAGGILTAAVALGYSADTRPAFVAPIYGALGAAASAPVPSDAPPMFIAAATDDGLGMGPDSVALYTKWVQAGKSAELHMYAKGGHGFGMRKQGQPSDAWIEQFADWLKQQGLLTK